MSDSNHNLPYLKQIRQNLRNNLTFSEARLWSVLKNKQLLGRKFRRQHSIGNFIVDFFCHSEKLIIEIDGSSHDDVGTQNHDTERDEKLIKSGFTILHFKAVEIRDHLDNVLNEITANFESDRSYQDKK